MTNNTKEFDLAIIGGGPGGYVAAIKAAQLGLSTCLIEKDKVGGTCLHRGCIPTKSLLYSAYLYHLSKRSQDFGIKCEGVTIDFPQVRKRKELVVNKLYNGVKGLLKKNRVEVVEAEGRLSGLSAKGKILLFNDGNETGELRAKKIIIASGSAPLVPSWLPFDRINVLSSDELLELDHIPSSLIIAGGGDIGIEFAYLFNTLGCSVTVVEMKEGILPFEDNEISTVLQKQLTRKGIKILTETMVEHVSSDNNGVTVEIKRKDGQKETITAEKMLAALGRRPVAEKIGTELLGIELNNRFIKVNGNFETTANGIYAIGDIAGPPLLAHAASQEGILAVHHITGKEVHPYNPHLVPRVNYSHPQVASIGLTTREAEEKGYDVQTGKFPFAANSKAIISGEEIGGFVKIVADKKYGEVLGVHIIGPEVSELIGGLSMAMSLGATHFDISNTIFPHPTLSEVIKEVAHAVEGQAIHI
ncbi:MAG: dihydrolipoyl dehydrogenase [Nitrospirae bacterium]|nr:dihydrolipoyl dehydrogenase [Nitrospirota bacterium]